MVSHRTRQHRPHWRNRRNRSARPITKNLTFNSRTGGVSEGARDHHKQHGYSSTASTLHHFFLSFLFFQQDTRTSTMTHTNDVTVASNSGGRQHAKTTCRAEAHGTRNRVTRSETHRSAGPANTATSNRTHTPRSPPSDRKPTSRLWS